jgi:hypothetical protein
MDPVAFRPVLGQSIMVGARGRTRSRREKGKDCCPDLSRVTAPWPKTLPEAPSLKGSTTYQERYNGDQTSDTRTFGEHSRAKLWHPLRSLHRPLSYLAPCHSSPPLNLPRKWTDLRFDSLLNCIICQVRNVLGVTRLLYFKDKTTPHSTFCLSF